MTNKYFVIKFTRKFKGNKAHYNQKAIKVQNKVQYFIISLTF